MTLLDDTETLNIYTTHRLGKIERAVLRTLAENTLDNEPLYGMSPMDELHHSHRREHEMTRNALLAACGWALAHLGTRSAYSAFGRAVHSLFDKGLVNGLALAWCIVEKDSEGKFIEDGWLGWAGPGRPAYEDRTTPKGRSYISQRKSPVLSVVMLSEAGWAIVRQDQPGIGLCPMCKEYLSLCNDK